MTCAPNICSLSIGGGVSLVISKVLSEAKVQQVISAAATAGNGTDNPLGHPSPIIPSTLFLYLGHVPFFTPAWNLVLVAAC